MSETVSDFVVRRLAQWGVRRIFGYPGDGINGVLGALNRDDHGMEFVQTRHEELAAFMASGHAKFTGELGVCLATSGPGAIHVLNGLYDAKMDHVPVLAIVGQQARASLGGDYQQEVDLTSLFKDVAHEYVHMATTPEQVRHLLDRAIRTALATRSVTCLVLPNDLQRLNAADAPHEHGTVHSGPGYRLPSVVPQRRDLERAAEILNQGERIAMLVGAGALQARDEVIRTAEVLDAGVAKSLLGLAVVPDDVPFCTGSIGLLGTRPSVDLMNECDTLLMIGSSFPYSEFLPKEGRARGVQIDIDGKMLGMRYPMDLNLVGDAAETLRALLPLLRPRTERKFQQRVIGWVDDWRKLLEERAQTAAEPINPQLVFRQLSSRLPTNTILTADTGSVTSFVARDVRITGDMMVSFSGGLATMGPAIPYGIAAKFAFPERPVVACVGDGAMQLNGLNGLITLAKYRERWANPCFVVVVMNNRDLNMVTWEQRVTEGQPKYAASQELPDLDYAKYAELLGLGGARVTKPEELPAALDAAFRADRPFVLDVLTDPNVPPIPPHISAEQAGSYARALLSGDADALAVLKRSVASLFPSLGKRTDR
ncbi:MAG TPA: thiamine pyrophosphate-requiring protein [Polyangiaceae bacterium]|jgi:pyruvate dehydrogenase (quinone)|nr:thiamine pyrophosphate-requiring protein [Polyangiaceae bacterium]